MGEHLNLKGGTLNLDGGTLTLDGGARPPHNLSTDATRSATRILLRERGLEPKVNFLQQKLSNLGDFAGKNNDFNAISITFCTFLKPYESLQLLKLRIHWKN